MEKTWLLKTQWKITWGSRQNPVSDVESSCSYAKMTYVIILLGKWYNVIWDKVCTVCLHGFTTDYHDMELVALALGYSSSCLCRVQWHKSLCTLISLCDATQLTCLLYISCFLMYLFCLILQHSCSCLQCPTLTQLAKLGMQKIISIWIITILGIDLKTKWLLL